MIEKDVGLRKAEIVLEIVNEMLVAEDIDFDACATGVTLNETEHGLLFHIPFWGNVAITTDEQDTILVSRYNRIDMPGDNPIHTRTSVALMTSCNDTVNWKVFSFDIYDFARAAAYVATLIHDGLEA